MLLVRSQNIILFSVRLPYFYAPSFTAPARSHQAAGRSRSLIRKAEVYSARLQDRDKTTDCRAMSRRRAQLCSLAACMAHLGRSHFASIVLRLCQNHRHCALTRTHAVLFIAVSRRIILLLLRFSDHNRRCRCRFQGLYGTNQSRYTV